MEGVILGHSLIIIKWTWRFVNQKFAIWPVMKKTTVSERKTFHNSGHNIMELYIVLVKVRFAAGKTRLDIYCHKPGRRVASQVAERRKTWDLRKLWNNRKISNLVGVYYPVPPPEIKLYEQSKKCKRRCQNSLVLSNFSGFLHFVPNIFSGIVII